MRTSLLKQNVNTLLSLSLVGVFAFWTILFYVTHETRVIANSTIADIQMYLK